jgi:hypothetical protein
MNPLTVMVREKDRDVEVWVENTTGGIDLGIDDNCDMHGWVTMTVDEAQRIVDGLVKAISEHNAGMVQR